MKPVFGGSLIPAREIFPLQKAMLLNWYRTSFALPSAPTPDLWTMDTLQENSWKQRSYE